MEKITEQSKKVVTELPKSTEVDIYRDTALRYCGKPKHHYIIAKFQTNIKIKNLKIFASFHTGYSNEVGESFRPLIPKMFVHLSYAVAISYVLAECADKTYAMFKVNTD